MIRKPKVIVVQDGKIVAGHRRQPGPQAGAPAALIAVDHLYGANTRAFHLKGRRQVEFLVTNRDHLKAAHGLFGYRFQRSLKEFDRSRSATDNDRDKRAVLDRKSTRLNSSHV